jgi:hypothetical protein
LGNLEVLKELELDANGHVMATNRELINIRNGIQLIEDENENKYLQSDGQDIAMAIVFG